MELWEIKYFDSKRNTDVRYMGIAFNSEKKATDELERIFRQEELHKEKYGQLRWPGRSKYRVQKIKLR